MPWIYKVPGYTGNFLMLIISAAMFFDSHMVLGVMIAALSCLNLYLIYKLDLFSRPEAWLTHQLEITKLREALLESQRHVEQLETPAKANVPSSGLTH